MEAICNKLKAYLKVDSSQGMEEIIETLDELSMDLVQALNSVHSPKDNRNLVRQHLELVLQLNSRYSDKVSDFQLGLEWINVTEPLSLYRHLKGKLILLDFFTYCCINCMHVLPDLKKLENEFSVEDGLVVIGVHSAKFSNEKNTGNIQSAARRYEISHPIVNDSVEGMWSSLNIHCWPSIIVLGPKGEALLSLQGEGHYEVLQIFIKETLEYYKSSEQLSLKSIAEISEFKVPAVTSILSYPGKVTVSPDGNNVAISDTAHHRVVITSSVGEILHEVGGEESGFADGSFEDAAFYSPQGLCFIDENTLIVADTENHAIRKIDLSSRQVHTLVGNGKQGHDYRGGKEKVSQQISSPWDVCYVPKLSTIFIAMAGTHQIWAYCFSNCRLWNKELREGHCMSVVGSGREENRNGRYPEAVGLAQPSGLSYLPDLNLLCFADSESSTVRAVNLTDGSTVLLAGGTLDPKNLFAFGDLDGVKMEAKLQHPLDIACHSSGVFVADSYNHKIKLIDPTSKMCSTVDPSLYQLNEPGGMYCFGDKLYIADTNNHCIKVMNITDKTVSTLNVRKKSEKGPRRQLNVVGSGEASVSEGGSVQVAVNVTFPVDCKLNTDVPSSWTMYFPGDKLFSEKEETSASQSWDIVNVTSSAKGLVKARLFLCDGDLCSVKEFAFEISVCVSENASSKATVTLEYDLSSKVSSRK